jgi:hypothetical protein
MVMVVLCGWVVGSWMKDVSGLPLGYLMSEQRLTLVGKVLLFVDGEVVVVMGIFGCEYRIVFCKSDHTSINI